MNSKSKRSVLVIDDEEIIREMLRRVLEDAGFDVVEAENGRKGIQSLETHIPDIVITDIIMPEKEGIETIMELRRDHPELKIIAISGGDRGGKYSVLEVADKLGAHRVLAKPFRREQLLSLIDELI